MQRLAPEDAAEQDGQRTGAMPNENVAMSVAENIRVAIHVDFVADPQMIILGGTDPLAIAKEPRRPSAAADARWR
jgi:hypothetical protein